MAKLSTGANKKKGNIMDIVSDANYGVDTRGDFKGTYFVHQPQKETNTIISATEEKQSSFNYNSKVEERIKKVNMYNEMLFELDPIYSSLEVLNEMTIIRLFKMPIVNQAGMFLSSMVNKPSNGDPGRVGEKVEHPFPFQQIGVVVSTSSKQPQLRPGRLVQVTEKTMNFHWNLVKQDWEWPALFRLQDGDEGYILIRDYDIQVVFP